MTDAGLRKPIWNRGNVDGRDVGEAVRDLDRAQRRVQDSFEVRSLTGWVYAPPFIINTGGRIPAAMKIGQVRAPGAIANLAAGDPIWDTFQSSPRINSISGLTVGTRYDLTLLLFYAS